VNKIIWREIKEKDIKHILLPIEKTYPETS
jgi:hypothetical protein